MDAESQPVALGGGGEFGNNDIAIVTLDTHVENVPSWTLLFSPLTGPTHATITGYGIAGVGTTGIGGAAGIDYRRRSAENMIDALMSSADWVHNPFIGGPGVHSFDNEAHSLYWRISTIRPTTRAIVFGTIAENCSSSHNSSDPSYNPTTTTGTSTVWAAALST